MSGVQAGELGQGTALAWAECVSLTLTCGFPPWVSGPPHLLCTRSWRRFPVHGWEFSVQAAPSLQTWGSPPHGLPSVEHSMFTPPS